MRSRPPYEVVSELARVRGFSRSGITGHVRSTLHTFPLVTLGVLAGIAAGCRPRAPAPAQPTWSAEPAVDSTAMLSTDTLFPRGYVSKDTLFQDFERPYIVYLHSNHREVLWLCSRGDVRVVFDPHFKPDWPSPGNFNEVTYQFLPAAPRTDTFRIHGGNWMERDVEKLDLSALAEVTELRVRYQARGPWPSAGDWRIVLADSARAALAEWADSCRHGRW
jgi:hypothetical protein